VVRVRIAGDDLGLAADALGGAVATWAARGVFVNLDELGKVHVIAKRMLSKLSF
jgi:hypothetical protein